MNGDQFEGVDMDISRRIADKLGMELELISIDFPSLFSALASNIIDMAASSITITNERSETMDFTEPYYVANQVLIANKNSEIEVNSLEDIGKYTVGSLLNTTGHLYLESNLLEKDLMQRSKLKLFPTNIDAINELLSGKLDLVVIDDSAAGGYIKQIPIKIAWTIETKEKYGIAMQKGKALNEKISNALAQMIKAGEVKRIIDQNLK
jgi:polar amino acid transport system substrate-binding protein